MEEKEMGERKIRQERWGGRRRRRGRRKVIRRGKRTRWRE